MALFCKSACFGLCVLSLVYGVAEERSIGIAKERQIPQSPESKPATKSSIIPHTENHFKAFTGKVVGSGVRIRLLPDVESAIVKELKKDDLVVVTGEKSDFYAVEPPSGMKVYVFRSFILDNIVEGNRVNVRLSPELTAPVVGYMNNGERVNGAISEKNHKWLEINPPKHIRFFVAKEFIEKVGGPEIKVERDKKRESVIQLMDSAALLSQSEMMKPFEEIDFERVTANFNTIIHNYSEFPEHVEKAKTLLLDLQEKYLQKKLSYLETKAIKMSQEMLAHGDTTILLDNGETALTPKDRMKIWERVEESLFLSWASSHHQKTINDFYEEQKMAAIRISGIVEVYNDIVKNKPGNYIIRDRDMPRAYLYSTFISLQNYVGKYTTLLVVPRPNNNFAFPAYFVLSAE